MACRARRVMDPSYRNRIGEDRKDLKKHHLGAGFGILALLAAGAYVVFRWRTSGFSWSKFVGTLEGVDCLFSGVDVHRDEADTVPCFGGVGPN